MPLNPDSPNIRITRACLDRLGNFAGPGSDRPKLFAEPFHGLPMSTTWLFIGLLGGRELAISLNRNMHKKRKKATIRAVKIIIKDLVYALIGLAVSLILTLAINGDIRREVYDTIFG